MYASMSSGLAIVLLLVEVAGVVLVFARARRQDRRLLRLLLGLELRVRSETSAARPPSPSPPARAAGRTCIRPRRRGFFGAGSSSFFTRRTRLSGLSSRNLLITAPARGRSARPCAPSSPSAPPRRPARASRLAIFSFTSKQAGLVQTPRSGFCATTPSNRSGSLSSCAGRPSRRSRRSPCARPCRRRCAGPRGRATGRTSPRRPSAACRRRTAAQAVLVAGDGLGDLVGAGLVLELGQLAGVADGDPPRGQELARLAAQLGDVGVVLHPPHVAAEAPADVGVQPAGGVDLALQDGPASDRLVRGLTRSSAASALSSVEDAQFRRCASRFIGSSVLLTASMIRATASARSTKVRSFLPRLSIDRSVSTSSGVRDEG
jgi:hypothetical protein